MENLLDHKVTCHVKGCTKLAFQSVEFGEGWTSLFFPFNNVFHLWFVNRSNLKGCHDANIYAKVEKLFVFLITKLGLLHTGIHVGCKLER